MIHSASTWRSTAGSPSTRTVAVGWRRAASISPDRLWTAWQSAKTRPERVFAAVPFDGGYRTDDGGKSWKKVFEGDTRCFAVDPHDDRVVYAGLGPVQLMRSEDGGDTWENLESLQQDARGRSRTNGASRDRTSACSSRTSATSSSIRTTPISY